MIKFLEKIFYFLEKLSEKVSVAGLQISDSFLQLFLLQKEESKVFILKIPPGIIVAGRIVQKEELLKLLKQLHNFIYPQRPDRLVSAVVSLPAELIYTQSFKVPYLDEERLEESALLNLKMTSPLPAEKAYFSWQVIEQSEENYEFLGAVVEKEIVDDFKNLLAEAKFLVVVFEFPALALSRAISREFSSAEPVLFIHLSSDGLNFFILKNSFLTFDYFRSWRSIQGEERQITKTAFEAVINALIIGPGATFLSLIPTKSLKIDTLTPEKNAVTHKPNGTKYKKMDKPIIIRKRKKKGNAASII